MDESIRLAKDRISDAKKAITEARAAARNDKRKKARLVRKASALSAADLERIKVLKRCGLACEDEGEPMRSRGAASGSGSAGSERVAPAQGREEEPDAPTEDMPEDESGGENVRKADDRANKETSAEVEADTRNE